MTRFVRRSTLILGSFMLALPLVAAAQQGPGAARRQAPRAPQAPQAARAGQPPLDATALLNARRALDLTPRQVSQLDSIERSLVAERRQMETRMRAMGDSVRGGARRAGPDSAMRARMETMRPQMEQMRRRDSTSRAAAQRVLTDTQRQQVREMQAEERGRQRGMREAQQRGRDGAARGSGNGSGRNGGRGDELRGGRRTDRGAPRPGMGPGARGPRPTPPAPPRPAERP